MWVPAGVYCPDACEADMGNTILKEDDMGTMKILYQAAQVIRY